MEITRILDATGCHEKKGISFTKKPYRLGDIPGYFLRLISLINVLLGHGCLNLKLFNMQEALKVFMSIIPNSSIEPI